MTSRGYGDTLTSCFDKVDQDTSAVAEFDSGEFRRSQPAVAARRRSSGSLAVNELVAST